MKKTILIGTILAIVILISSTIPSVIGYQTMKHTYLPTEKYDSLIHDHFQGTIDQDSITWFPGYYSLLLFFELLLRAIIKYHEITGTDPGEFFLIVVIIGVLIVAIGENGLIWTINEILDIIKWFINTTDPPL
jgi:hypothetical protein